MPRPVKKRRVALPEKIGKIRQHLTDNYSIFPDDLNDLKNGHMLLLTIANDRSIEKTLKVVAEKVPCKITPAQLRSLLNRTKKFQVGVNDAAMEKYSSLCCESYTLFHPIQEDQQPDPEEPPPGHSDNSAQLELDHSHPDPEPGLADLEEPQPGPSDSLEQSERALTMDPETPLPGGPNHSKSNTPRSSVRSSRRQLYNLTPRKLKMKKRLEFVSQTNIAMKERHTNTVKKLRSQINTQKLNRMKYLNQDISRKKTALLKKGEQIHILRKKLAQPQDENGEELATTRKKLKAMSKKCKRLTKEKANSSVSLSCNYIAMSQFIELQEKLRKKDETVGGLEDKILTLEDAIKSLKEESSMEKEGKTYSMDMRFHVYDLLVNNVPTKNIPILIEKFTKRLGITVEKVPHRSTVELMARELGIVSDFQAAEMLMKEENLTLGFDATTQEGVHVNSVHVTSQEECHVIDLDQLPGGTAEDYEMHIVESIDRVAEVYCAFYTTDFDSNRSKIISHIRNTMTDRAAVNHATIVCLENTWGIHLNELNCHLHPLDTIASSSRSALKEAEPRVLIKKLFGTECMAVQLVLSINKFRFKDGRGDPKGFTTALLDAGLPKGLIPRYRGTRLHILFLTCGKLVEHEDFFQKFFKEGTVSCGGLQASILHDFLYPVAKVEIQILGLIGKILSGPWMRRFYTSTTTQISHVDGISVVKQVLARVKACCSSPQETLTMKTDFFGDELTPDNRLMKLQQKPIDEDLFMAMMKNCLTAIVTVLEKQYRRYFDLDVTNELRKETESARCHNIDAEQVMGMFSAAKANAPNATLCYISSRLRAQKNRVVDYLDSLEPAKREKLMKLAITLGRKVRQRKRKKCIEIRQEISRRVVAKKQQQVTYQRNKLEARLKQTGVDLATEFPVMEVNTRQQVQGILDGKIVGHRICHIWYDQENQEKTVYFGKIEKVLKRGGGVYVVGYWGEGETYEDDAVDYDMKKCALAADLMCGDLTLS